MFLIIYKCFPSLFPFFNYSLKLRIKATRSQFHVAEQVTREEEELGRQIDEEDDQIWCAPGTQKAHRNGRSTTAPPAREVATTAEATVPQPPQEEQAVPCSPHDALVSAEAVAPADATPASAAPSNTAAVPTTPAQRANVRVAHFSQQEDNLPMETQATACVENVHCPCGDDEVSWRASWVMMWVPSQGVGFYLCFRRKFGGV